MGTATAARLWQTRGNRSPCFGAGGLFLWTRVGEPRFHSGYFMKMRPRPWYLLLLLCLWGQGRMIAQATPPSASNDSAQDAMSRDLLEVTIPELEQMYSS